MTADSLIDNGLIQLVSALVIVAPMLHKSYSTEMRSDR